MKAVLSLAILLALTGGVLHSESALARTTHGAAAKHSSAKKSHKTTTSSAHKKPRKKAAEGVPS